MATVEMIASARLMYGNKVLRPNDEFTAVSEAEADDLVAVRMAKRSKVKVAQQLDAIKPGTVVTRNIEPEAAPEKPIEASGLDTAEGESSEVPETPTATPSENRQHYNRRDLRAKR